jgi:hypothetical protein
MNALEHLTENQLAGYSAGSLSEAEARAAGRHLLECEACRKLMPVPSPERFISVLMTENDQVAGGAITTAAAEKSVFRARRSLSGHFAVLNSPAGFAWSAGALALILTVTAFLWIYAGRQQTTIGGDHGEIARINSAERQVVNPPVFVPAPRSIENSNSGSGDHPDGSKVNDNSFRAGNGVKAAQHKDKLIRETERDSHPNKRLNKRSDREASGSNSNNGKIIVSTSRSLNDCPPGAPEIVLSPYFETVIDRQPLLRWKEVPRTVKYEIYVSDSAQILIEKAEVKEGTSYRLQAELLMNRSYKWKIVAVLAGGERVSSDPVNFSVGIKARRYPREKIDQIKANSTRCVEKSKVP